MKYIALTIGPIYKTLQDAKKPKELWSGSYLFSYLMKKIVEAFRDREFVTPYIKDESIFADDSEVGLFHDRFIFRAEEGDMPRLQSAIDAVVSETAERLGMSARELEAYLQINYGEYDVAEQENPIVKIMPYLDTQELFFRVAPDENGALQKALKSKENFLLQGKKIVDDLKRLTSDKYYCIVHADGDNMSRAIADKSRVEEVSKSLFEHCGESHRLIKAFGGQTIFAGGDDLLFIAPVVNKERSQTIFNLCDTIGQTFEKRFEEGVTLSFGISINYIKYPLYEALESSRHMLFGKAKDEPKNAIAFRVIKHSGQGFESVVRKGSKAVYDKFLIFSSNIEEKEDMDNFLHSIHHKIDMHKTTLEQIAGDKQRLHNFFDNYFNEAGHDAYRAFFVSLIDFIYEVYQDGAIAAEEKINLIYATLRFVKFIKGDKQ